MFDGAAEETPWWGHEPTAFHRGCMRRREVKKLRTEGTHIEACPRTAVSELLARGVRIPALFFEQLEENQLLKSCCRHPENHTLTAHYTSKHWKEKRTVEGYYEPNGGVPDFYIFQCTCGRIHQRGCSGVDLLRPIW